MADDALTTPAPRRAEETCARVLTALFTSFLFALIAWGMTAPDPVASGHAWALEAVR